MRQFTAQIIVSTWKHFNASDGLAMASHVALAITTAIFPFLIFAISLAAILGNADSQDLIIELVLRYWPDVASQPFVNEIHTVLDRANVGSLSVGLLLTLFFASNGISAIRTALNRAYGDHEQRSIFVLFAQNMLFIVLISLSVLIASLIMIEVPGHWSGPAGFVLVDDFSRLLVLTGILVTYLVSFHIFLPGVRRPLKRLWPGLALTLVLLILVGNLFSYFISVFATYSATYAGLAGIMTALVFFNTVGVVLILGGELNAALERRGLEKDHLQSGDQR